MKDTRFLLHINQKIGKVFFLLTFYKEYDIFMKNKVRDGDG